MHKYTNANFKKQWILSSNAIQEIMVSIGTPCLQNDRFQDDGFEDDWTG